MSRDKDTKSIISLIHRKEIRRYRVKVSLWVLIAVFMVFSSTIIFAQERSILWNDPIDMTTGSTSTNALFPSILCDQYQNTHLLWSDRNNYSSIYYSNDVQGDWLSPTDVITSSDVNQLMLRLSSVIDNEENRIHLLWVGQWIKGILFYSNVDLLKAKDPRAWSKPLPLAIGTENGAIDVDGDDNLHIVYGVSGSDNIEVGVEYIRSADQGQSWSVPRKVFSKKAPFPTDPFAQIAIDGEGRIHVGISLRSQDYGVYSEIGYIRSLDGGQTWGDYELVDDKGTAFQGVNTISPYAFGDDEIHLTWHDPRRMHRYSIDGGSTWSEPDEIMPLGAAFGGPNALSQDSSGAIHVVTAVNGGVYSSRWDGSKWGPAERIDNRQIDPHGQEIAICQGNKLQVVYDDRGDSQKIWYSSRTVEASKIARQPMPTPEPMNDDKDGGASEALQFPDETEVKSSSMQEPTSIQNNSKQAQGNPLTPLLIASGAVIGLLMMVFLIRRR